MLNGTSHGGIAEPPAIHLQSARLTYGGTALFEALDLALPAGRPSVFLVASRLENTDNNWW